MTDVYVISGFLGAGKTTLIQKLIRECFAGRTVAVIENEYGEENVDAQVLGGRVKVREITAGCICCSLLGDFVYAMEDLAEQLNPDAILIEPSGVGKLSDVTEACLHKRINRLVALAGRITVVDVKRCQSYLENFGEFFTDQLERADTVVFSRVDLFPDRVNSASDLVREHNPTARVFAWPLDALSGVEILAAAKYDPDRGAEPEHDDHDDDDDDDHDDHDHGGEHEHHHHHGHAAEEVFIAATVRPGRGLTEAELRAGMARVEAGEFGRVLRAKGILATPGGTVNLQYVPGALTIEPLDGPAGGALCLIGEGLDTPALNALFQGA